MPPNHLKFLFNQPRHLTDRLCYSGPAFGVFELYGHKGASQLSQVNKINGVTNFTSYKIPSPLCIHVFHISLGSVYFFGEHTMRSNINLKNILVHLLQLVTEKNFRHPFLHKILFVSQRRYKNRTSGQSCVAFVMI